MVNLVVNILFGFVFESIYFGFAFNKIKGIKCKSTYIIFLISYVLGSSITQFLYNKIYVAYILCSFIFTLLYKIIHKESFEITDVFLMLNILLISSILTAIPIIFIGYNNVSMIFNAIKILMLLLLILIIPFNKLYKLIMLNWNRTANNKIKSDYYLQFAFILKSDIIILKSSNKPLYLLLFNFY